MTARKLCCALLGVLAVLNPALAVAPEIKDGGKFFSPEAVKKANKEIREIARKYDRDLLIETVMTVPADQAERVKAMSAEDRAKFFRNWAADRADAAVVNGVYILVCKEPAHLEIYLTAKSKSAFDSRAFDRLRQNLLQSFRKQQFDEGLSAAVSFVRERFEGAATK